METALLLNQESCFYYDSTDMASTSSSHMDDFASLGIIQPPLGDKETLPTAGPSGRQERLNCCEKNLR